MDWVRASDIKAILQSLRAGGRSPDAVPAAGCGRSHAAQHHRAKATLLPASSRRTPSIQPNIPHGVLRCHQAEWVDNGLPEGAGKKSGSSGPALLPPPGREDVAAVTSTSP